MKKYNIGTIVFLASLLVNPIASAALYTYSDYSPVGNNNAGDIGYVNAQFDSETEQFSMSATVNVANGNQSDGFWLVVSDGPGPENQLSEYAILYGDNATGNISAYVYNGENNWHSWKNSGGFIGSYAGALTTTKNSNNLVWDFSIDASAINSHFSNPDWSGLQFDESIGMWFHGSMYGADGVEFGADGQITGYDRAEDSWYDIIDQKTVISACTSGPDCGGTVSAPGTLVLLVAAMMGMFWLRKTRNQPATTCLVFAG